MTVAPCIFAICRAKSETPPVPCTRTVWPARRWPCSTSAFHAVSAAQGSVAASSKLRCAGAWMRPDLREDALGGEDAVDGAAECRLAGERLDLAVEPVLEEESADAVAGLEACDGSADGDDLTGGVRAEDAWELHLGVVLAEDDHEIAIVE